MKSYIFLFFLLALFFTSRAFAGDTIAPKVTLVGNDTVILYLDSQFHDPGVMLSDNQDPDSLLRKMLTATNNINNKVVGFYFVTYKLKDAAGNNSTPIHRVVEVVDRIAPVITLKGEPSASICRWALYTDAGYDLHDNYDAVKEIKVTKEGTFHGTDTVGLYYFRYKATDKSGNFSYSEHRYILVTCFGECDCGVGIEESKQNANSILVYPNPASDFLYIDGSNYKISVIDEVGKQVNIELIRMTGKTMVPVSHLNQGTYFVKIQTVNGIILKEIQVIR